MAYSRWATVDELKTRLTPINYDSQIKRSGVPMMYDEKNLYIKDDDSHTLVVGSTGCGKTQTLLLPRLRLAIKAEESMIVHDVKGEIFDILSGELKKQNYNVVVLNIDNPTLGNCFNPLHYPYELYKEGNKDDAVELLEDIAHYICCDETANNNVDPFWSNSAMSLFVGLALYLFDNAREEEINFNSILNLISNFEKVSNELKKCDITSQTYIHLSNIIMAPSETRGSIVSVFIQQIKAFVTRESLLKMMSLSDFDIKTIKEVKTAVFIISNNKSISRRLVPMIISEFYFAASKKKDEARRLNVMIDEFEGLIPIKDFNNMLTLARGNNIIFNVFVRSFLELRNTYGKEGTEVLKIVFGNIIYLLANDFETLEEISRLCGNVQTKNGYEPLISVDDLKLLNRFEAVILMPRINPIKTILLPDFKIDWKFSDEKIELKKIDVNEVKTYQIN